MLAKAQICKRRKKRKKERKKERKQLKYKGSIHTLFRTTSTGFSTTSILPDVELTNSSRRDLFNSQTVKTDSAGSLARRFFAMP
jgi:hypothetical protein